MYGIDHRAFPVSDLLEKLKDGLGFGMRTPRADHHALHAQPGHEHIIGEAAILTQPVQVFHGIIHSQDEIFAELLILRQFADPGQDILNQYPVQPALFHPAQFVFSDQVQRFTA